MIPAAEGFPDLLSNLSRFLMEGASQLPENAREHVLESANHPSPVDRIVNTAEAMYAVKEELTKEGRDMTAQLAQFAAVNGFHGMSDRGQRIALAMNRIGGYTPPIGMSWPTAEDDPAPLERYAAPEVTPAIDSAGAPAGE